MHQCPCVTDGAIRDWSWMDEFRVRRELHKGAPKETAASCCCCCFQSISSLQTQTTSRNINSIIMRPVHIVSLILSVLVTAILFAAMRKPSTTKQLASSDNNNNTSDNNGNNNDNSFLTFSIQIPPPGTYVDQARIRSETHMDVMGMQEQVTTIMHMESTRTVQSLAEGGTAVDTTVTRASFQSIMKGGMGDNDMSCDSETSSTQQAEMTQLEEMVCTPFYNLVGSVHHFVMDDEGHLASASQTTSELDHTKQQQQQKATDKISPSNTLEQSSRILHLLPTHPVREQEEWDSSVDMGDNMGHFTGTSKFVGLIDFKGQRCAVIQSAGSLEIDFDKVADLLGDMGSVLSEADIHIKDSAMNATVYWDEQHKISRWTKTDVVMTMKNPVDGSINTLPITETVSITTDLGE